MKREIELHPISEENNEKIKLRCLGCKTSRYIKKEDLQIKLYESGMLMYSTTCPTCKKDMVKNLRKATAEDREKYPIVKAKKPPWRRKNRKSSKSKEKTDVNGVGSKKELEAAPLENAADALKQRDEFERDCINLKAKLEETNRERDGLLEELGNYKVAIRDILDETEMEVEEIEADFHNIKDYIQIKEKMLKRQQESIQQITDENKELHTDLAKEKNERLTLSAKLNQNIEIIQGINEKEFGYLKELEFLRKENEQLKARDFDNKRNIQDLDGGYKEQLTELEQAYKELIKDLKATENALLYWEKKVCQTCKKFQGPVNTRDINNCTYISDDNPCGAKLLWLTIKRFRLDVN